MSYIATIAARQSQFGSTTAEFNVVDSDGVMPPRRVAIKLATETPSAQAVRAARDGVVQRCLDEYLEAQALRMAEARRAAYLDRLRERLSPFVDSLRADAAAQLAARIQNLALTSEERAIAEAITLKMEGL